MKRRMSWALAAAVLSLAAAPALAQENGEAADTFSIYGYAQNRTGAAWPDEGSGEPTMGDTLSIRLKADWEPSERLSFHMEVRSAGRYGGDNEYALYEHYGIPAYLAIALGNPAASPGDLYPYEDFHWSLAVDHAYGRANFGPFDLAFGKLPIAWGTAYVFNPTAKAYPAAGLDFGSEETPGILALAPSLALGRGFAVQAYLAFQERSRRNPSTMDEGDPANLPFGVKVSAVLGSFDLSASFFREVVYYETLSGTAAFERRTYAGLDFAGGIGAVGLYAEAALGLPSGVAGGTGPEDFDLARDLEAAVGFDWTVPGAEVDLRGEYYYRGAGADDEGGYDVSEILNGRSFVLGRHYVFLYASRIFADYWTPTLAVLVNAGDGSWLLLPELKWDAASDLEVKLSAMLPFGSGGSEFGGKRDLSAYGLGVIDLIFPAITASVKLSF